METNLAYDLFLLMFNLTQLHSKDKIIELFIEGIQEICKPVIFTHSSNADQTGGNVFELRTRKSSYGVIVTEGPLPPDKDLMILIRNSIQILAVTLEHLDYELTLEDERNIYEAKATKSLVELKQTVKDLQDSRTASINLIEDLSEEVEKRRDTEKELLLKNLVFDESIAANSIADKSGILRQANTAFIKIWGYNSKEEVLGRSIAEFVKFENEVNDIIRLLDETGQWNGEYTALKKDGTTFYASGLATIIRNGQGEPIGYQSSVQDITERKRTEEALRENEEKFRHVFEDGQFGMALVDKNFRFLHVNDAFCRMIGYSENEMQAFTIKDITHSDHLSEDVENINKLYTGSIGVYRTEKRYVSKDKGIVWGSVNVSSIRDKHGNFMYYLAMIDDITKRKLSDDLLRQNETLLQNIIDNSNSLIYTVDAEGKFLMVNRPLMNLLSGEREQIIGKTREEFLTKEISDIHHNNDLEVFSTGKAQIYEEVNSEPDGRHYYLTTKFPLFNNQHEIYAIGGLSTDITERKKTEEALRISEEKFKYIFDHSVIGKSITLPTGEMSVNQAFCDMLGYNHDELTKTKWQHISYKDDIEISQNEINSLLSGKKDSARFLKRYSHKNGSIVWTEIVTSLRRDDNGIPLYFLTTVIDITERKIVESKIKQLNEDLENRVIQRTEQLQVANKELEAFSYSVSHDLRAPLRAIHSFTSILHEDYGKVLDEEGNRICSIIEKSSVHMGQLIDDLLAFSRIGRTGLDHVSIDMELLAKSIYSELTTREEQKRITFNVEKLQAASGDAVMMRQVITNLLSNAIKYSSKKEKAKIIFGSELKDGEVIYFMKDNGVGFDMQYSNKLFGVFQRLHSAKEFEGNGVGLAIVQRIILRHEGRVWAEGEKGNGAIFYFALPVNKSLVH